MPLMSSKYLTQVLLFSESILPQSLARHNVDCNALHWCFGMQEVVVRLKKTSQVGFEPKGLLFELLLQSLNKLTAVFEGQWPGIVELLKCYLFWTIYLLDTTFWIVGLKDSCLELKYCNYDSHSHTSAQLVLANSSIWSLLQPSPT